MITKHEYLEENEFATLLDSDVHFTGSIETKEPNLIKGTIDDSKIKASLLVIVESSTVSGDISSHTLSVLGSCSGKIRVYHTLTILPGGCIEGKIIANTLSIEEGGILNGECNVTLSEKNKKEAH